MAQNPNEEQRKARYHRTQSFSDDSGVYRWLAVLSVWTCWFVWDGMLKTLSILLPTLQIQFKTQTWILGWMATIVDGACDFVGPLAAPLGRHFGSRVTIMVCGILTGAGFILASSVNNVAQLGLILVTFVGLGIGISTVLTRNIVGLCFTERYVMANGIGQTGNNFAHIVLPPVVQLLLTTYGWRGAMLLIGATFMHIAVCGALLKSNKPTEKESEPGPNEASLLLDTKDLSNGIENSASKPHFLTRLKSFCQMIRNDFNTALLSDIHYWILLLLNIGIQNTFVLWRIYFVPHVTVKGESLEDAALFLTIAGIVALIVKVVHGPLVDHGIISCRTLLGTAMFISTIGLFIDPWMDSNWQILTCAIMVLSCISISYNLRDVLIKELMGKEQLASAFGWLGMSSGIMQIATGFLPGWIYDHTGSYDMAFIMLGCTQSLGLLSLAWLKFVERNKSK